MKYISKPKVIEAIQFNGDNLEELKSFCGADLLTYKSSINIINSDNIFKVYKGDYIVKDNSEYFLVRESVFNLSYNKI